MTGILMRTRGFTSAIMALAGFLASSGTQAQFPEPGVDLPEGAALRVAPGADAAFVFEVRNTWPSTRTIPVTGGLGGAADAFSEYAFTSQSGPSCAAPVLFGSSANSIRFDVGPLAPNESLRCIYGVARRVDSINDLTFGVCRDTSSPSLCWQDVFIGSLPDMQLIAAPIEPIGLGTTSALVRLTARNPLGPAAAARRITTECTEFEFGQFGPFPFDLENDFPGACPTADQHIGCLNFTGTNYDTREFLIGPTPAGGEASCLVRLRMHEPLAVLADLEMSFTNSAVNRVDGGLAFDPVRANGVVRVGAVPGGSGTLEPARLPLSPAAAALLAVLLGGITAMRLRYRARA